jgi:hypothetical protein
MSRVKAIFGFLSLMIKYLPRRISELNRISIKMNLDLDFTYGPEETIAPLLKKNLPIHELQIH